MRYDPTSLLCASFVILAIAVAVPLEGRAEPEWIKAADERTGYEVWQITSADSASQAGYYESQIFTNDERFLVFSSSRSGRWEMYRADLSSGEISPLGRAEKLGANSFTMHPDGRHVFFWDGWFLVRADVPTAEVDTVVDFRSIFDAPPRTRPITISHDGRFTAVQVDKEDEALIAHVDLETGATRVAARVPGGVGHLQISPADPYLVAFVRLPDRQNDMTAPMSERARTWLLDVRTGVYEQFLTVPYGHRATHPMWSNAGDRFFFFQKTQPGWMPVSIMSMNSDGGDWRVHYTSDAIRLGHGDNSTDDRWFVSDGQDPHWNPLILINVETGASETLCWPDASITGGHAKQAHVHPTFSPSGRYVAFTSDRTGVPQVYVVPIEPEVYERLASAPTVPRKLPMKGERFVPDDVDWKSPIYETGFDYPGELSQWLMEGGHSMSIEDGRLRLQSRPGDRRNHLVAWMREPVPADFMLEFSFRPRDRNEGLAIVFFNTRGRGGESIFDPSLAPRDGTFPQYHSGDLDGYHVSYWAGDRDTSHVRKNHGFHLVAKGSDLIRTGSPDAFQIVRIYKRGGNIRLVVDDTVALAYEDDGEGHGPVHRHAGWIGLRQMGHTGFGEYDYLKVYRLLP